MDVFAVQWDAGTGGTVSYTAVAIGADGSRTDCVTLSSSCTIRGLHCGLTYSIAVIPSTANCGSINSTDYKIESGKGEKVSCKTRLHQLYCSDGSVALDQHISARHCRVQGVPSCFEAVFLLKVLATLSKSKYWRFVDM